MTLSNEFMNQLRKSSQEQDAKQQAAKRREDAFEQQLAPIQAVLDELETLPVDADGYSFSYSLIPTVRVGNEPLSMTIRGQYLGRDNQPKVTGEVTIGGYSNPLESKFEIVVREKSGGGYSFTAIALDRTDGGRRDERETQDVKEVTDNFIAAWTGRNIPGAAAALEEKEKAERQKKAWKQIDGIFPRNRAGAGGP